jgi:ElaB/YqjD/DUF883 family membrane-anchored ribosome-binding protein
VSETPDQREPDEAHEQPTTEDPVGGEETVEEPPPTETVEEPPPTETVEDPAIPRPMEDPAIPEPVDDPAIPERVTPDPDRFTEGLVGGPVDLPPRVAADFPVVFRGYDREVVDAHLAAIEEDIAELHANRTPQSAVRRELERVGQETAAILQRAHEAADEVARRARTKADARIEEADRQAEEMRREAEARLRRIDKDTDDVWADRRKLLEDARAMGEALIRLADEALARFPPAEDGGPPVEPPPPVPRRPARPTPAPPRLEEVPRPTDEEERVPDESDRPLEDGGRVTDQGDASIESVRRIPRPGAPTHPRRPRR